MKTDASYTKRKFKLDLAGLLKSMHRWTKRQLKTIKHSQGAPICLELESHLLMVGTYQVEKINERVWRVRDGNQEFVHDFVSRPSAVFYCVCAQTNQVLLSHKILKHDNQLGLLEADGDLLRVRFRQARAKKNGFSTQLYAAKLAQNIVQQKDARLILEKTLKSAKYLKLWENVP